MTADGAGREVWEAGTAVRSQAQRPKTAARALVCTSFRIVAQAAARRMFHPVILR